MSRLRLNPAPAEVIPRGVDMAFQMTPVPAAEQVTAAVAAEKRLIFAPFGYFGAASLSGSTSTTKTPVGATQTAVVRTVTSFLPSPPVIGTNVMDAHTGSPETIHGTLQSSNNAVAFPTLGSFTINQGDLFGVATVSITLGTVAGAANITATAAGYTAAQFSMITTQCAESVLLAFISTPMTYGGTIYWKAATGNPVLPVGTIYAVDVTNVTSALTVSRLFSGDTLYAAALTFTHHWALCFGDVLHWDATLSNGRTVRKATASGPSFNAGNYDSFSVFIDAQITGAAFATGVTLVIVMQVDTVTASNVSLSGLTITVS